MIKVTKFGETIYIKDWRERLAEARKNSKLSDNTKKILNMSPKELEEYDRKREEEIESNFWGSKERLAYYRSHGLTNCSDYPGGDAAFKQDVLSGDQREEHRPYNFDLKREDAYICKCIEDGCFKLDWDFRSHFHMHPKVALTFEDAYMYTYECMCTRHPDYEDKILSPDSEWYNDKPSVGGDYCPVPDFPLVDDE